ncbi:sulfite oxidase [Lepeophtheirus salmonis]|uniref:sulfite oxidase n=1 Tax=Lepeophtheirus salmonis TaxID=72036 RepID=A0A0K2T2F0_LEPSM|nr:sulfite oxidase-like [Lepeophtheirus salmonis]
MILKRLIYLQNLVPKPKQATLLYSSLSTQSFHYKPNYGENEDPSSGFKAHKFIGALSLGTLFYYLWNNEKQWSIFAKSSPDVGEDILPNAGHRIQHLPTYNSATVAQHSDPNSGRVWVTFKEGVYDITDFISQHPGGEQLLLAAGSSIEPFWHLYAVHKGNKIVYELLEGYRIGNLDPSDVVDEKVSKDDDPFSTDPKRHPVLKPLSAKPFNAEPPLAILADSYLTPNEFFYVRNHLPVPILEEESYELDIDDQGNEGITLSLHDLKNKFPKYTVTAAIQCGGNRRTEMNAKKPLRGLGWKGAAIGNAEWSGARLTDVLAYYGIKNNDEDTLKKYNNFHVQFEGYDVGADGKPFGASIPLSRALDPSKDVLLAYEMNGVALPRDHGYPIRAVVPGTVGVRNVKWLARITIAPEESDTHFQKKDYKSFNPSINWDNVDFDKSRAIQNMPVTSAICRPTKDEIIHLKKGQTSFKARGYAWSGGGAEIIRMDLTVDGCQTWFEGSIIAKDTKAKDARHYSWVIWEADIPVREDQSEIEICGKAVDSNLNVQPESFENIWNLRGMASNAYPRVSVSIKRD